MRLVSRRHLQRFSHDRIQKEATHTGVVLYPRRVIRRQDVDLKMRREYMCQDAMFGDIWN